MAFCIILQIKFLKKFHFVTNAKISFKCIDTYPYVCILCIWIMLFPGLCISNVVNTVDFNTLDSLYTLESLDSLEFRAFELCSQLKSSSFNFCFITSNVPTLNLSLFYKIHTSYLYCFYVILMYILFTVSSSEWKVLFTSSS